MLCALILFAQDKVKEEGPGAGLLPSLMPILLIVVVFYFLIIMPGRKEKQQRQSMLGALKKNDKIITNGGIIGVVLNLKEGTEEVTIKSDETKLLILKSSIARIITEPEKDANTPKPQ
jgi:preprotein translocase subunit YajC